MLIDLVLIDTAVINLCATLVLSFQDRRNSSWKLFWLKKKHLTKISKLQIDSDKRRHIGQNYPKFKLIHKYSYTHIHMHQHTYTCTSTGRTTHLILNSFFWQKVTKSLAGRIAQLQEHCIQGQKLPSWILALTTKINGAKLERFWCSLWRL